MSTASVDLQGIAWVDALRDHLASPDGPDGFSWLNPDAADAIRAEWLDVWSQVAFAAPFHAHCRERLLRCVPLAVGPARDRRLSGAPSRMTLVCDPDDPEHVALSLSHAMPSACWGLCAPLEISDGLRPYLATTPAAAAARHVRFVKPLDADSPDAIQEVIDGAEPWVDDAFWGSAHESDPWQRVPAEMDMLSLSVNVQRFSEHDAGRRPTVACRTLWSQSTLRIEQHPRGLFSFEVAYVGANDGVAIGRLSELIGVKLPEDLPVDVAASLLRGPTLGATEVAAFDAGGSAPLDALALWCALAPADPATEAALRAAIDKYRSDDRMLGAVAGLASKYHYDALLFELADVAPEPLQGELIAFLAGAR